MQLSLVIKQEMIEVIVHAILNDESLYTDYVITLLNEFN